MKPFYMLAITTAVFAATDPVHAEDLQTAMRRLSLQSVLVVQSQAVDEQPVWSPKGDALAVNIEGKWLQVPLGSVTVTEGKWRGGLPIGVLQAAASQSPVDEKTVRSWEKAGKYEPRKVEASNGTIVELRENELSTEFVITKKGSAPERVWQSGLENCHGLGLSPDREVRGLRVRAKRGDRNGSLRPLPPHPLHEPEQADRGDERATPG